MRILAITSSPLPFGDNPTDGVGYRIWVLMNRLVKDYDIHILSLYEDMYRRIKGEEVEEKGLKITPIKCNRRVITKYMDEFQPNFIYISSWPLYIFLPKLKIPLIIDFIGPSLIENIYVERYPHWIAAKVKAEALLKADFIICSNDRLRNYLMGFFLSKGADKRLNSIYVIPVTPPDEPPRPNKNFKRIKSKDEKVVLVAGSLNPWYDYETLFKAAEELVDLNFRILFMGDNPKTIKKDVKKSLIAYSKRYGVEDRLIITGSVPFKDRANFYLQSDAGLNLAEKGWEDELSSRARVIDYFWAGIPIITSGRDYYSQLMLENSCAYYFETGDNKTLSKLIRKVLFERPKAMCGRREYSKASKLLNLENYMPQLKFLEDLTEIKNKTGVSFYSQLAYSIFNWRIKST